ncbi:MAG: hypothetical protein Q4B62_08830 [Clostridiaceae bacterium]|nr:hypothetical protein [Clostridiaceae bacterium]MDO4495875.1 hypothetical protein [Clostridiaceae bacterium]
MRIKVVGLRNEFEYTSKKTGEKVKAITAYYVREPNSREDDIKGLVAENLFITSANYGLIPDGGFSVNAEYDLIYENSGRYAYLIGIIPIDKGSVNK